MSTTQKAYMAPVFQKRDLLAAVSAVAVSPGALDL